MESIFTAWTEMDPAVKAAWAQAILSALAILAAIWIASWQHGRDVRARVRSVQTLVAYSAAAASTAHHLLADSVEAGQPKQVHEELLIASKRVIDAVALDSVADARLILPISLTSEYLRLDIEAVKMINGAIDKGIHILPESVGIVKNYSDRLRECSASVDRIDWEYGSIFRRMRKRKQ